MKYTQQEVKAVLSDISKRTKDLLNSEELMNEMTFDERINESIVLTGFEQDIRFLLNEPWQELEKEIIYLEKLISIDPYVDVETQLERLKEQRSKRGQLEEEGMKAYEEFRNYRLTH